MRKRIAAAAMTATMVGGAAVGAALIAAPNVASAQESTSDDTSATTSAPVPGDTTPAPVPGDTTPAPVPGDDAAPHGDWTAEALAPLVADGTITQEQADAVIQALEDARPEHGPRGGHGHGHGPGFGMGAGLTEVAGAIGISEDDLRTALEGGQTIAEIAQANGVDPQTVVDALVAAATTRIDQAVTDGDLTQERATEILGNLDERITDLVNGEFGGRGPGFGGGHDGHPGTPGDDDGTTDGTDDTTETTVEGASLIPS